MLSYLANIFLVIAMSETSNAFIRPVSSRFWSYSYFMLFGVGVSCRILYSIVSYLYVSCSGSATSVGEERADLSAIVYL